MGNLFAGSEVVDLALQVEKNGRDFYNAVAANSRKDKPRQLFEFLAQEEERHIITFQKLMEKVEKYDPPEVYADDYIAYMNALASEHIFTRQGQGVEQAKKASTDLDAVSLGIKFESDSIIFYEGMKQMVPVYDHKILNEIIEQEKMHLVKLSELKTML
jgi:rubrerythrin